jgi:biotin carboxyl carrier protein
MGFKLTLDGTEYELEIVCRSPHLVLRLDGQDHEISASPESGDGHLAMVVSGMPVSFARVTVGDKQVVRIAGRSFDVAAVDPFSKAGNAGGGQDEIRAPMPGAVVSIQCSPGDAVTRGQALVTIESMKLQTALLAPRDGVVAQILRDEGGTFEKDEIIVRLEAEAGDA